MTAALFGRGGKWQREMDGSREGPSAERTLPWLWHSITDATNRMQASPGDHRRLGSKPGGGKVLGALWAYSSSWRLEGKGGQLDHKNLTSLPAPLMFRLLTVNMFPITVAFFMGLVEQTAGFYGLGKWRLQWEPLGIEKQPTDLPGCRRLHSLRAEMPVS